MLTGEGSSELVADTLPRDAPRSSRPLAPPSLPPQHRHALTSSRAFQASASARQRFGRRRAQQAPPSSPRPDLLPAPPAGFALQPDRNDIRQAAVPTATRSAFALVAASPQLAAPPSARPPLHPPRAPPRHHRAPLPPSDRASCAPCARHELDSQLSDGRQVGPAPPAGGRRRAAGHGRASRAAAGSRRRAHGDGHLVPVRLLSSSLLLRDGATGPDEGAR